jgi:hypothetical protein
MLFVTRILHNGTGYDEHQGCLFGLLQARILHILSFAVELACK